MKTEIATLAGGCFWGVEELFRNKDGILRTTVGYTGGETANPTYDTVKLGKTGHAESIEIEFNPEVISFSEILDFFFTLHDPTTLNQQGNDIGSQYRSEIFYNSESQKENAHSAIEKAQKSGLWSKPIVTKVSPAKTFYSAEDFHQKYLEKNPGGYTCHFIRK